MQEWVDTLRLKLREMKILSPKENLYSKLPEARPPLLPTRDPTRDPLPLPPPVPAAIVPGVIVNTTQTSRTAIVAATSTTTTTSSSSSSDAQSMEAANSSNANGNERNVNPRRITPPSICNMNEQQSVNDSHEASSFMVMDTPPNAITTAPQASTSNTLSQNLIKMLYPLPNFNHQTNNLNTIVPDECELTDASFVSENQNDENISVVVATITNVAVTANERPPTDEQTAVESIHSLARTFAANVLFDPNTSNSKRSHNISNEPQQSMGAQSSTNQRTNDSADDTISVDSSVYGTYPTPEPIIIPRFIKSLNLCLI